MFQFYFLSILLNFIVGLVLIYSNVFSVSNTEVSENKNEKLKVLFSDSTFFANRTFLLVVGILSVFTGIMKFFCVVRNVLIIGDFLPAIAGIVGGFAILFAYYRLTTTEKTNFPELIQKVFVDGHKYIGIFCIIAGFFHFIIPNVLFF